MGGGMLPVVSDVSPVKVWRPNRLWYWIVNSSSRYLYYGLTGGLTVLGAENIPRTGSVIIAPNHVSNLDPPAVSGASPRQLRFMAKQELFKGILGWGIGSVGAFPVRRGENDTDAIRKALELLADGQALLIFPEGERGDGTHLGSINRGVAMLAKRSSAPIVPTAIIGTHVKAPKGSKRPKFQRVTVAFGKPFTYAEVASSGGAEGRDAFGAALASRLMDLCRANGLELLPPVKGESPSQ